MVALACSACEYGKTEVGGLDEGSGSESGDTGDSLSSTSNPTTTASTSSDSNTTAEESSDDGSSSDTTSGCAMPLTEEQLIGISVRTPPFAKVAIGESSALGLQTFDDFGGPPVEIDACVQWSVEGTGATISADGVLMLDAQEVHHGDILHVTADIEEGRKLLEIDLIAYVPMDTEFVGAWHEVRRIDCETGDTDVPVDSPINELIIYRSGDITVTWEPFEVYIDYWGEWSWDEQTTAFEISDIGGNYVPVDMDASGTIAVDSGVLRLGDMWLGSPQFAPVTVSCGHEFE